MKSILRILLGISIGMGIMTTAFADDIDNDCSDTVQSGHGEYVATPIKINLPCIMEDKSYSVVVTPTSTNTQYPLVITNKSNNSFVVTGKKASGSQTFDWIAVHD